MRLLSPFLILALLAGCTVYKSSDRDDFDANGKVRAPRAAQALTRDERDFLANPCAAFNALSDEQLTSLFGPTPRLSMQNELSSKTSTCLVSTLTNDLSAPSILACSWKSISGERIEITNEFAPQTTERELQDNGFDVVTSTVVAGERLRMNCEAYVPTSELIADRRSGEISASKLKTKFSTFTQALATETVSASDVQP